MPVAVAIDKSETQLFELDCLEGVQRNEFNPNKKEKEESKPTAGIIAIKTHRPPRNLGLFLFAGLKIAVFEISLWLVQFMA